MELDPVDGEIDWKPTANQAGTHPVEVEVEDPFGGRSSQEFALTIDVQDAPPPASAN